MRQSDRTVIYETALDRLRAAGLVYACQCSRREIERAADHAAAVRSPAAGVGEPRVADPELRYAGTCSARELREREGLAVRVRLAPSLEAFDDLRHGHQEQHPSEQCGDLLVRDRDRNWTYQFAVTVDDLEQGVTLVIRGDDLLPSTGRQIQLARLLGRERPPAFLHHALVMKSPTRKLSKADRDTSVRDLRAAGQTPAYVIASAARSAGLTAVHELAPTDVAALVGPLYLPELLLRRT